MSTPLLNDMADALAPYCGPHQPGLLCNCDKRASAVAAVIAKRFRDDMEKAAAPGTNSLVKATMMLNAVSLILDELEAAKP